MTKRANGVAEATWSGWTIGFKFPDGETVECDCRKIPGMERVLFEADTVGADAVPASIIRNGVKQKLGDSMALASTKSMPNPTVEDKKTALVVVRDRLLAGEYNARPGGAGITAGAAVAALARFLGEDHPQVVAMRATLMGTRPGPVTITHPIPPGWDKIEGGDEIVGQADDDAPVDEDSDR